LRKPSEGEKFFVCYVSVTLFYCKDRANGIATKPC